MKRTALFLCTLLLAANVHANDFTGNFNVFFGKKSISDDLWETYDIDSHGEYGFLFNLKKENWPISLTADVLHSSDKADYLSGEIEGSTTEFDLGVTKHWKTHLITPYVGGGLAIINADYQFGSTSENETEVGIWGKAGVFTILDDGTNIGFEIRHSVAKTEYLDRDVEIGGLHAGFFIGYHW